MKEKEIFIKINPIATPRPRFRRVGNGVQTYYKKDYKNYLGSLKDQFRGNIRLEKPLEAPIGLVIEFSMPRPKYHYGTGRNAGIVKWKYRYGHEHITKPDLDNMVKAVKDALSGVLYNDDSQVIKEVTRKKYASWNWFTNTEEEPGIKINYTVIK